MLRDVEGVGTHRVDGPVHPPPVDVHDDDRSSVPADATHGRTDAEAPGAGVVAGAAEPGDAEHRGDRYEQLTVRGLCEEQPAVTRVLEAPPHDRAPTQAQDDVRAQGPDESLAQGDPGAFEPSALGDLRVELEPGAGSDLRLEVLEQSVPSHGRQSRRDLL